VIAKPQFKRFETPQAARPAQPHESRIAYFDGSDAIEVPVFRRNSLAPGATIDGPAVIEEKTSTTVLYPGQRARVDEYLNMEVELLGT
jgi:N-methylhydantoinase A